MSESSVSREAVIKESCTNVGQLERLKEETEREGTETFTDIDRIRERETNVVQLERLGKKFRGQIRNFIQIHSISRSNLIRHRIRLLSYKHN